MNVDFTNKVVLVSGASAGIGEATAILFAKYGAKVVLVGTNVENLQKVAVKCESERNIKPLPIAADLSTDEGCEKTAKETIGYFGRLDVLVNNAGVSARTTIETTDMAAFDRVFNLNLRGVYNLTRLLVPELVKTKGNIVNISSTAASFVAVGSLPYAMTKAALNHFTRLIALELAPKGVRVNTISPGITVSTFTMRITGMSEAEYNVWLKEAEKTIPMGVACTGDDIARMVLHLASDNSRLVTGTNVFVDGGNQFSNPGSLLKRAL